MSSVLNSVVKNLESLPSSLLKDLSKALGQSKTGNKEILAHRIVDALSQKKKDVKSPTKRRGYEDRQQSTSKNRPSQSELIKEEDLIKEEENEIIKEYAPPGKPLIISGFPGSPTINSLPSNFVSDSSVNNATISIGNGSSLTPQQKTSLKQLIYNALTEAINILETQISNQGNVVFDNYVLDGPYYQDNEFSTTVNFYKIDTPNIESNLLNFGFGRSPIYGGNGDAKVYLKVRTVILKSPKNNAYLISYVVSNGQGFYISG